jgi:hypothetical protein
VNDDESKEEVDETKIEETQTVEEDLERDMTEMKMDDTSKSSSITSDSSSTTNKLDRTYSSSTTRSSLESLPGTPESSNSGYSVITICCTSIKILRVCNIRYTYTKNM